MMHLVARRYTKIKGNELIYQGKLAAKK